MKIYIRKFLLMPLLLPIFIFVSTISIQGQTQWHAGTWFHYKTSALTYTFDDNTGKQLTVALPILDKYGFKATFYPVKDWSPDWNGLKKAFDNSHEVGSHTLSHPDLSTLDTISQESELKQSRLFIDSNIGTGTCLTISYPFCKTGIMDLVKSNYISGRICSGAIEPSKPKDLYKVSSIMVGSQTSLTTADQLNTKVKAAKSASGWCVFLIHGIDDDGGYSPLSSTALDAHLDFVNTSGQDYWVGTFLEVSKYIRERNCLTFSEQAITPDSLLLTAADTLDNTIYNQMITVRRPLPAGWDSAVAYLDQNRIPSYIISSGGKLWVQIDILPDNGLISIVKVNAAAITNSEQIRSLHCRVAPNPFPDKMVIETPGIFAYEIYSLDGRLMKKGSAQNMTNVGADFPQGMYILSVKSGNRLYRNRICKD